MRKKILNYGLSALLIAGIGYSLYNRFTPTEKLAKAGTEVAELKRIFSRECNAYWCSDDKYKKPEEVVKARKEAIENAGCKDKSVWMISDRPEVLCMKTDITDCKGFDLNSDWTIKEGKLRPYGTLVNIVTLDKAPRSPDVISPSMLCSRYFNY